MTNKCHEDYRSLMDKIKDWMDTPEGAPYRKRLDDALKTEEPTYTLACDAAWDYAEAAYHNAHKDKT